METGIRVGVDVVKVEEDEEEDDPPETVGDVPPAGGRFRSSVRTDG